MTDNTYLLTMTFRVWVIELAVSAVNYFLLMKKLYEPRYGKLRAHQIGMPTRIVYIFIFAYFILFFAKRYTTLGWPAITAGTGIELPGSGFVCLITVGAPA